jgi:hypothetical protein
MKGWKAGVVGGLAAAVLGSGAMAIAQSQGNEPPAQRGQAKQERAKGGGPLRGVVHADMVAVDRQSQSHNVVYDRGEITSIDSAAKTFDLKRRDGAVVKVTVSPDTKIRGKGEDESFEDLKVGDRLMAFAERTPGGLHWKLLRCIRSADGRAS